MQGKAQGYSAVSDGTMLAFKRHILEKSAGFASEPLADLYRVQLLGMMIDRFEALREKDMSEGGSLHRVLYEFDDIAERMQEQGFAALEEGGEENLSSWPQLTEDEAARYIRERDAYMHRIALGVLLCVACFVPLMALCGLSEMFYGFADDAANVLGLIGMFGMIGTGVYAIVSSAKPRDNKKIKRGRFSLSSRLRRKLETLCEQIESKARRRRGKGVAMIVTSLIPVFVGTVMEELWFSDAWPLFGVGGMFLMIAIGVYELVMADGEKKTVKRLLDSKE